MFFLDDDGVKRSLPVGFTDAISPDVFVTVAVERSPFRVDDLVVLAGLVAELPGLRGRKTAVPGQGPFRCPQGGAGLHAAAALAGAANAAQPALRRGVRLWPTPAPARARRCAGVPAVCPATSGPRSSWVLIPATYRSKLLRPIATLLVPTSMKNRTYRRRSRTVPTVKKSQASIVVACARKNSAHVGPDRRGAGSIPGAGRSQCRVTRGPRSIFGLGGPGRKSWSTARTRFSASTNYPVRRGRARQGLPARQRRRRGNLGRGRTPGPRGPGVGPRSPPPRRRRSS